MLNRLQASPDPSRPPIFQVMFAHQRAQRLDEQGLAPFALGIAGARLSLHGLTAESVALDKADRPVRPGADDRPGRRSAPRRLEYSTDLFVAGSIDRLASGFRTLLAAIVADPARRIADLPLVSEPERHQLLGCCGPRHRRSRTTTSRSIIDSRGTSNARPDAVALVCGRESLTYGELNRLANALAHRLIDLGVGPETVVGLHLERWPSRLIGLLGVLKAGGAYLPLDPDHPAERLASMLQDSGATVVLTEERSARPALGTPGDGRRLRCPPRRDRPGPTRGTHPPACDGENLAYVVFTSGTTGRPKGVMVPHRGLLAVASAWEAAYDLRRAHRSGTSRPPASPSTSSPATGSAP